MYKRVIAAIICLLLVVSSFSVMASDLEEEILEANLQDIKEYTQEYFAGAMKQASYSQFEDYLDGGETVVSKIFDNEWQYRWKTFVNEHGEIVEAVAGDVTLTPDGKYSCTIQITGTDNEQENLTVIYTDTMLPLSIKREAAGDSEKTESSINAVDDIKEDDILTTGGDSRKSLIDGFRGYVWGTPIHNIEDTELKKEWVEGKDFETGADGLFVATEQSVGGLKCITTYAGNTTSGLIAGLYNITQRHSNAELYYNDYLDLIEKYRALYGSEDQTKSGADWYSDLYKDRPEKWGMAAIAGDAEFYTRWSDTDGDMIVITLRGDNYEAEFTVAYISANYEEFRSNRTINQGI